MRRYNETCFGQQDKAEIPTQGIEFDSSVGEKKIMGLTSSMLMLFLVGMFGIAYLDYATGKYLSVWGLYLVPVGLASWIGGMRAGIVLSVASCALMYLVGIYGGHMFAGTGYFLLGILNRFLALLLVSWLASYLFRKQMLESTLKSYEECMDYLHASPKPEADSKAFVPGGEDSDPVTAPPDRGR